MTDFLIPLIAAFGWGLWAGELLTKRSLRDAIKHYEASKKAAADVIETRQFTGPGVSVQNVGTWSFRGKRLKVTIEEREA